MNASTFLLPPAAGMEGAEGTAAGRPEQSGASYSPVPPEAVAALHRKSPGEKFWFLG